VANLYRRHSVKFIFYCDYPVIRGSSEFNQFSCRCVSHCCFHQSIASYVLPPPVHLPPPPPLPHTLTIVATSGVSNEGPTFSAPLFNASLRYGSIHAPEDYIRTVQGRAACARGRLAIVDLSTEGKRLPSSVSGILHLRISGPTTSTSDSGLGVLIAMWLAKVIQTLIRGGYTVLVHCDSGHSRLDCAAVCMTRVHHFHC
jgi:hypothetical protein